MKKTYVFLATLFIIFSCSDDDNSKETTANTSIIGTWNYTKRVVTCSNSDDENFVFLECFQMSTITFTNDGKFIVTEFQDNTGICIETDFDNGIWSMDNENLQMISESGSDWSIPFFEITETSLKIGRDTEGITCGDGSEAKSTYFEFTRFN